MARRWQCRLSPVPSDRSRDSAHPDVALPQLLHFALAVPAAAVASPSGVIATIVDQNNQTVLNVTARPGETRTAGSVLLTPGTYRMVVRGASLDGGLTSDLIYTLLASISSEPFVADPGNPTFQPEFQCDHPGHEGLYCYPGEFVSPEPFLWSDFINTLPETPPAQSLEELIRQLLGDWWRYVWRLTGTNGPTLAQNDVLRYELPAAGQSNASSLVSTATYNILENDIDPEGDAVVAVLGATTANGQLTLNPDGTLQYTPNAGFIGVDEFTYTAYDFINSSRVATVRIHVGVRGNYDEEAAIDGHDFLAWQRSLDSAVATNGSGADGDGNGVIDAGDLQTWQETFGETLLIPPPPPPPPPPPAPAMAAMAGGFNDGDGVSSFVSLARQRLPGSAVESSADNARDLRFASQGFWSIGELQAREGAPLNSPFGRRNALGDSGRAPSTRSEDTTPSVVSHARPNVFALLPEGGLGPTKQSTRTMTENAPDRFALDSVFESFGQSLEAEHDVRPLPVRLAARLARRD
jgi:hypothetical protein